MKNLIKRGLTLLMSLAMIITYMPMSMITAYAAAGETPEHKKEIKDNKDGTYTISLDVVGDSEKQPNNVNVIVIVDRSGSMSESAGGGQTRMSATQTAVNNLANTLLSYNGKDGNPDDTVEMALVSFATTATTNIAKTTSYSAFSSAVNNLRANGGTNWEDGLDEASGISFGDNDPTFVIFFSDGAPTFHSTDGGYNNWNRTYGVYGTGQEQETNMNRSYNQAVDDAKSLATKVGAERFYTIFAYGESYGSTYMTNLTSAAGAPAANNYSASDTAGLQAAFTEILAKIEMSGIGNVEIDDGTTNQVTTSSGDIAELLEVDTDSFKYYKGGSAWAEAPEAELKNGAVEWDLSEEGVLENGVRYTVTFDCYPSQYTYDTIAKLKNGDITYDSLDPEIKKYIVDNGGGSYSLRTNTNATLSYDDTRDDAGQQTTGYENPDPVATDASTLTVKKEWEGADPDVNEVTMTVLMDEDPFHETKLNTGNNWSSSSFISVGIIKDGKVLTGAPGHDFKFAELDGSQYHWELDTPTVHPMLVDGTLTMLVKEDATHPVPSGADTYTINGSTYFVDSGTAGLTATNHRRSNLNLTKKVTGEDAPKDATFPFTLQVNNPKAPAAEPADDPNHDSDYWLWFSIYDTVAGKTVTDATLSGEGLEGPNDEGYYHIPSKNAVTVQMKDGWNLRFLNLPTGTTYTFTEGTLADGFAFSKAELTSGTDKDFKPGQTSTGKIQESKTSYTVTYTNDYQLTDLEITKIWDDADNQDGKRLTADELKAKLTLNPDVEGAEPTVVDNKDGTFTITYTGLPRFADGKEVEYTVAEGAVDGYTTTGSPAKDHGEIKNTHTPEEVSVAVDKVWDDADDQDGVRPDSVSVQLKADGKNSGAAVTLNKDNDWAHTWTKLPKYAGGKEISYTVEEAAVAKYTTAYSDPKKGTDGNWSITVTNTHKPDETEFTVNKVWNDKDYVGKPGYQRPSNLTVTLIGEVTVDGKTETVSTSDPVTVGTADDWSYTWEKLPKNNAGNEISYKVIESDASGAGYTTTVSNGTVTNTPVKSEEEYTPVELKIVKQDANTKGVLAGAKFEVKNAEGETVASVTTDENGEATVTFTEPGTYNMTETAPTGYNSPTPGSWEIVVEKGALKSVTYKPGTEEGDPGFWSWLYELVFKDGTGYKEGTLTVPNPPKTTNVEVKKIWSDSDNQDGKRPASVTYQLYKKVGSADPVAVTDQTKTLNGEGNEWTATFEELPAYEDGKPVTYSIKEMDGTTPVENGGKLGEYTAEYSNNDLTVTNKYETETVDVNAVKVWDDKDFEGKAGYNRPTEVKFNLLADGKKIDSQTKTVNSDSEWKASWAGLDKFKNGTEIKYTVTEDVLDNYTTAVTGDAATGFTVTNTPKTVELDTNTSAAVQKQVVADGEAWADKTFNFTIAAGEGAPAPEKASASVTFSKAETKTIDFGKIVFTEPGTYEYTVTEADPGDGWTCETSPQTFTVTVTMNKETGELEAKVDGQIIKNLYKPEGTLDTKTNAVLTKTVEAEGTAWADKTFDFTIAAVTPGAPVPSKTAGSATFSKAGTEVIDFGTITFTKAGEYEYTVTETTQSGEGWKCDNEPKTVKITVTDNGDGTLTATPAAVDIKNVYEAKPVKAQIKVTKTIEGYKTDEGSADDTYTMTLAAVDNAPMPAEAESGVVTTNGTGENLFGEIEYTKVGEYKYTVTEKAGNKPGVTYDENTYNVTVKVTDNGKGQLVATVDYGKSTDSESDADKTSVDVTNTFAVESVDVVMSVTKKIDDQSNSAEDAEFTFVLKDKDKKELQKKTVKTEDLKGSVDFDKVTFDHDGEYTFYIQESVSEEDQAKLGWKYDTNEYPVVVKISDNLSEAKLVKDGVTYDNDKTELVVTNVYKAEPTTVSDITVKKTIEDTSGSAYEATFTFTLTAGSNDVDGLETPMPENNKASVTGEGEVTFAGIKYEKAGTYNYTVTEEVTGDPGYQYDTATYGVVVTVKDEGGKLVASVDYGVDEVSGEAKTEIGVVNTYDPEDAKVNLTATKLINDKTGSAPDATFTFELVDADGNVVETVEHQNGGTISFKELTFDKVGTYTYKIREVAGNTPGYEYDTAERTVTVTVTDPDKDGILKAKVEGNNPEIENPYEVDPGEKSVTDQIKIVKKLNGRKLKAGEFTFILKEAKGDRVLTAENDENGNVVFDAITFNKVGNYTFTVREASGKLKNVTYDNSVYTVVAQVTDPHTGDNLEVNWVCSDGGKIVFVNDYNEPPVPHNPDKPDTGDTNNVGGWLALMMLAAAGTAGLYSRRRREDQ